ncbi:MAG: hypothetical protein AAGA77_15210 [Bacteroidota bacterium]
MKNSKAAFDKTIKLLSNFLAPIGIIVAIKDFETAVNHLLDSPKLFGSLIIIFSGIFSYNLIKNRTSDKKLETNSESRNESVNDIKSINFSFILAISGLALILSLLYVSIFVGVHYPLIESSIDKEYVEKKVDQINNYITKNNIQDLRATYVKSWTNDYYGIILNGLTFSKEKAELDFEKARKVIPQYLYTRRKNPKDNSRTAHIYWRPFKKT